MRHVVPMNSSLLALDAGATTVVVDSTADLSDAVPGNGFCSVTTDICTLRAAIQEANALTGPTRSSCRKPLALALSQESAWNS